MSIIVNRYLPNGEKIERDYFDNLIIKNKRFWEITNQAWNRAQDFSDKNENISTN